MKLIKMVLLEQNRQFKVWSDIIGVYKPDVARNVWSERIFNIGRIRTMKHTIVDDLRIEWDLL